MKRAASHDTVPGVQAAQAAIRLYPELLTTPELRAIQARRLVIDRVYGQIRELQAGLHQIRCARIHTAGDADKALAKREADLEAQIVYLKGERA